MTTSPADKRTREENAVLREMVAMYSKLSGLAAQDSDLSAVVALVAERLGVSAAVIDPDLRVVAAAPQDGPSALRVERDDGTLLRLLRATARTRRPLTTPAPGAAGASMVVAPIFLGEEPVAYLLVATHGMDERGEDLQVMLTEHAAAACGIVLGRARVLAAASSRARGDLFEGLLLPDRNRTEVEHWARHLGIKPDQPYRVVTLVVDDRGGAERGSGRTEPADLVERYLQSHAPDAVVVGRGAELVALFPATVPEPRALEGLLLVVRGGKESVETRFPGASLTAGIGNCYAGAEFIARSYREARHAIDTARMLAGLGGVTVFADLGIHRLLVRVHDVGDLRDFAAQVLGPLLEHGKAGGTDYLTTLTVYFNENNSPQRTGRRLHMHPNTVAYRIRRIEEITGMNLGSYADRLSMQVALEIVNGLGDSR